jgi:hypothetical protein
MATQDTGKIPRVLLVLLRIGAAVQLVVGITLWTGHGYALRSFHMATGVVFVLLLWAIAGLALARRRRVGLALFALAWGLVIPAFGMAQQGLLIGDLHWIVRTLHLLIGLAAMPMAALLGGDPRGAEAVPGRMAA